MPEQNKRFIDNETLQIIRSHADWRQLFHAFGLERAKKSSEHDWWALSPLSDEHTASFHINDKGWYCHSTGQGGGVIELVQKVIEYRTGKALNCYTAGHWLIDNGLSDAEAIGKSSEGRKENTGKQVSMETSASVVESDTAEGEGKEPEEKLNKPIRQTLIPLLDSAHLEFGRRGISKKTCDYLGCGYLSERSKSPLVGRIVFQVRGLQENENGGLKPVILTHIGRAMTPEQEEEGGKWRSYAGFFKTLELYNIDQMMLDEKAQLQAKETGHVLIVEGCWNVAKLIEADIYNAVASFGAHFTEDQMKRLELIKKHIGITRFRFWYDRDRAGRDGQINALALINATQEYQADGFDWNTTFSSTSRRSVKIPEAITDVCECSAQQLRWLRKYRYI